MPKPWRIQVPSVQKLTHVARLREQITVLEENSVFLDPYSYERLLQSCACLNALTEGRRIHAHLVKCGFGEDRLFLENHLHAGTQRGVLEYRHRRICPEWAVPAGLADVPENAAGRSHARADNVYERSSGLCTSRVDLPRTSHPWKYPAARAVFDGMKERTVVSWNTLIAAYVQSGEPKFALSLFKAMQLDGVKPTNITFLGLLNACSGPSAVESVKFLHRLITESGLESDNLLCTCLMTVFGKCGCLADADSVFQIADRSNIVTWNALLSAYSQEASTHAADTVVSHLRRMLADGLKPVRITFLGVLGAFPTSKNAKFVQELAVESGLNTDPEVAVALSTMYTRAGDLEEAQKALYHQRCNQLDVVSWTSMMTTCSQNGLDRDALQLFRQMQLQGTRPTDFTIAVALEACANLVDADQGRRIHLLAIDNGFQLDEFIATALVNLYGKSGKLTDAQAVFDEFQQSNLVLTTALIASYSQNGFGSQSLHLYNLMQLEGEQPNDVTFVTILSACSHAGLLDEGTGFFRSMTSDHNIPASRQHYCCMVDLFGRLGHLDEAKEIINRMPYKPGEVAWLTLLGASTNQGDTLQGEQAIEQVGDSNVSNACRSFS